MLRADKQKTNKDKNASCFRFAHIRFVKKKCSENRLVPGEEKAGDAREEFPQVWHGMGDGKTIELQMYVQSDVESSSSFQATTSVHIGCVTSSSFKVQWSEVISSANIFVI